MFAFCNNLDNNSLISIAKAFLTMTNISTTYKNLSISNIYGPFYYCNKQINVATVGQGLITQLQTAG